MRYREMRVPCDTEVTVLVGEEARRARFVNISPSGARIEGLGCVPRDSLVTLAHAGTRIAARVVWSNDLHAGLRFPLPISASDIGALRGVAGRTGAWIPPDGHRRFRELT
jgi:hypothetical protein